MWTQRTLSTFQTFARGQDAKRLPRTQSGAPEQPGTFTSTNESDRYINGNGSAHRQHSSWNDAIPPPPPPLGANGHASLSPTSSSSSGGSPKNSIASNGSSGILYRYIENNNQHHGEGISNVSITHINGPGGGNGLSNGNDYNEHHDQSRTNTGRRSRPVESTKFIRKPVPVAVPKLHSSSSNRSSGSSNSHHVRSRSSDGQCYQTQLPNGSTLVIPPPAFSSPFPTNYSSESLPYSQNMESEFLQGYGLTPEDVCTTLNF